MPPRTKRMLSAGKRMRAKEPKKEYPTIGEFGQIMSGKSVFKLPKEAVEALNKPMINAPTDGRVESYPEYLRRLADDEKHSAQMGSQGYEQDSKEAQVYEESAQLIEDLSEVVKELMHRWPVESMMNTRVTKLLKRVTR